jgi:U3 small nucleolar RNA-associated protein 6
MLQVHGNNVKLWQEAASWEFFKNQSAENARRLLQLALRHFPTDPGLWLTLFNIEINYVKR